MEVQATGKTLLGERGKPTPSVPTPATRINTHVYKYKYTCIQIQIYMYSNRNSRMLTDTHKLARNDRCNMYGGI